MGGEECIIQLHEEGEEEEEVTRGGGESSLMKMVAASNWLRQTDNEVQELERTRWKDSERWSASSIYRVPRNLRKLNKKAYQPQVVSIGPYHHGKARLKDMEEHKHRALLNFLGRTGKGLEHYVKALAPEVQKLKDAYPHLQHKYKKLDCFKFLKMMIVDGCFILELVQWDPKKGSGRYAKNDPIFSEHGSLYLQPLLRRDMLMLENQIPLRVLVTLQKATKVPQVPVPDKAIVPEELRDEILKYFNPQKQTSDPKDLKKESEILKNEINKWGQDFAHILDLYRKSLILFKKDENNPTCCDGLLSCCSKNPWKAGTKSRGIDKNDNGGNDSNQRSMPVCHNPHKIDLNGMVSATKLTEAAISFKKSKTGYLNDKGLEGGTLKLPQVTVDATSYYMYLNLMAYERLHVGAGDKLMNEVTSYVFFMDKLIDTAKDVELLHLHGIIENFLGSDDDVAKLFNRITVDSCPDDNNKVYKLQEEVAEKYRKPGRRCLAYARHNYFTNPWVTLTIVAAILIFLLTAVQTGYAVLGYHHPRDRSLI